MKIERGKFSDSLKKEILPQQLPKVAKSQGVVTN